MSGQFSPLSERLLKGDMNALKNWKENILHKKAQALGKEKWYKQYKFRIGTVNRDYDFKRDADE